MYGFNEIGVSALWLSPARYKHGGAIFENGNQHISGLGGECGAVYGKLF